MKFLIPLIVIILLIGVITVNTNTKNPSKQTASPASSVIPGGNQGEIEATPIEKPSSDLIRIDSPKPGAKITSPVKVTGEARGNWYFEASFPIKILDESNRTIGQGIATAKGDWMTTDFVPFEAEITFTVKEGLKGAVVAEKDNPSGLPENDASLTIPVTF